MVDSSKCQSKENYLFPDIDTLSNDDVYISKIINHFKKAGNDSFIIYIFELFAGIKFEKDEAIKHWEAVIEHKTYLCNKLGRDAGLLVTILDYFQNIDIKLKNPKIIEIDKLEYIEKASKIDNKTGLFNNSYFEELLKKEINRSKRSNSPLSLLFLDIDNFKSLNDTCGHLNGDKFLTHVASIIKNSIRMEDAAGRFGGDEFVIMLVQTEKSAVHFVTDRIISQLNSNPYKLDNGKTFSTSISIGYSSYPNDGTSTDELLKKSDEALYQAKLLGKNRAFAYKDKIDLKKVNKIKSHMQNAVEAKEININIKNSKNKYRAYLKNISEDGMLLDIPYFVPLLNGVYLSGEISNIGIKPFHFTGKIIYTKKRDSGFLAKIQFEDTDLNLESRTKQENV